MQLIDVAIFPVPTDAGILCSILSDENIPYALNNENSAILIPGSGAVLSVNENDKEQALQIIREAGFENYLIG